MILISILNIYIYIHTLTGYFKFVNMTLKSLNYCIYFIPIVKKKNQKYMIILRKKITLNEGGDFIFKLAL